VDDSLAFHHIGLATRDIDAEALRLASLGYQQEGPDFEDEGLGIRGRFVVGVGPRIELVAPFGARDPLGPWLATGVKMYHLAWETPSLEAAIAAQRAAGAKLVVPPTPAVAFGRRPVAFLMLPTLLLIELIQSP
jgi:methylmalonyl-CoA/ethylmalonyl-CoA epimerase